MSHESDSTREALKPMSHEDEALRAHLRLLALDLSEAQRTLGRRRGVLAAARHRGEESLLVSVLESLDALFATVSELLEGST